MATEEIKYLGQEATEKLIENTKNIAAKLAEEFPQSAILYDSQELNEDQQSQARDNINAQKRTHWDNHIEPILATQLTYDENVGFLVALHDYKFVIGETYIVEWNGVSYTTTAELADIPNLGNGYVVIGNIPAISGGGNGIPFILSMITIPDDSFGEFQLVGGISVDGSTDSVNIKISKLGAYRIDNRYIDAEWVAKTNRKLIELLPETHRTTETYIDVLEETTDHIPVGEYGVGKFRVVLDSNEFIVPYAYIENTAEDDPDGDCINTPTVAICTPFTLYGWYNANTEPAVRVFFSDENPHTVSVQLIKDEYGILPEKYLPGVTIPKATTENNGQFLRVIDGAPAWSTVPNAEEATF